MVKVKWAFFFAVATGKFEGSAFSNDLQSLFSHVNIQISVEILIEKRQCFYVWVCKCVCVCIIRGVVV
jgi:hypothetical protein